MKNFFLRAALALSVFLVFAALGWLGGYNFDHRDGNVAFVAGLAVFFAGIAASYPLEDRG